MQDRSASTAATTRVIWLRELVDFNGDRLESDIMPAGAHLDYQIRKYINNLWGGAPDRA
jgi:hypothetical protein